MSGRSSAANVSSTADLILDAAERRAQVLGFNGFSYADVAAELGVTPASVHYHFPGKADLGVRLIERYTERFLAALAEIDTSGANACDRLKAYADLYEGVLAQERLCLCGMMAAEYMTLPESMRALLSAFFQANEDWLEKVLQAGRAAGDMSFAGEPRYAACAIIGAFEGAMLLARAHGGIAGFRASSSILLQGICVPVASV